MVKKRLTFAILLATVAINMDISACTGLLVGKKASG